MSEDIPSWAELKTWIPYYGTRGGKGWYDTVTDRVVYGDKPPGEKQGPAEDDHTEMMLEMDEEEFMEGRHMQSWDSFHYYLDRLEGVFQYEAPEKFKAMVNKLTDQLIAESVEDDGGEWNFIKPVPQGMKVSPRGKGLEEIAPIPVVDEKGEKTVFKYNLGDGPSAPLKYSEDELKRVENSPDLWVIEDMAEANDMTPDEFLDRIENHVRDVIDKSNIFTRTSPDGLFAILRDGRVKNQHEVGRSAGLLTPGTRIDIEKKLFGVSEETPVSKMPIYGYMHPSENGSGIYSARMYGQAKIKLKKNKRERTTYTFGDTLNNRGTILPSRVDGEFTPYSIPWGQNRRIDLDEELEFGDVMGEYIEAQIHDGVTIDDIEMVYLPSTLASDPKGMLAIELLKKKGVPFELEKDVDYD